MEKINDIAYSRNYGFWNEAEQKLICDSKISIAGVGGDGFQLGLNLVRMGVQSLNIADPEVFERENSNRVPGAIVRNYGRSKVEVFDEMAREINPDINIQSFKDGVTEDNVEDFVRGSNLLIDETELRYLHIGTMLARTARKFMMPNMTVMNIGFAGITTSFDGTPEKNNKITFEKLMGISENEPLDEIKGRQIDMSCCLPYIPNYGDMSVLQAINDGAPLPSIVQGVDAAASLGATEAFLHLTSQAHNHRRSPTWAPKFRYIDSYNCEAGVIEIPKIGHYIGLASAIGRSALNLNPHASYTKEDREKRNQK